MRPKAVGEFVPTLMRPAFEKYGFPAAALLTDWPAIAGAELARYTAPERLKWPRVQPGEGQGSGGATLILRVAGARGLEVEQMRPQLIERINACFGYRAVAEIRILQAPLAERKGARPPRRPAGAGATVTTAPSPNVQRIEEPRLQAALVRMASAIAAGRGKNASD